VEKERPKPEEIRRRVTPFRHGEPLAGGVAFFETEDRRQKTEDRRRKKIKVEEGEE
jgi:hypothetical protein